MQIRNKVVVITGGASGIGKALAERFHAEGARGIAVADLNEEGARAVAASVHGLAFRCDVSKEADIVRLVEETELRLGPIDLFCSNAGVAYGDDREKGAASLSNQLWQKAWEINVMSHVYAARALLPRMIARGEGYFLQTASAAGLLMQIGASSYSVTKAGAVSFAEMLAVTHGEQGIKVSVLCPQGVDTPMLRAGNDRNPARTDGVKTVEEVAEAVVKGIEAERFLILPHEEVATYAERKGQDRERWLAGMRRLRAKLGAAGF
ncbi:MAG: SDR family oxidoreductase [Alphaproteobacteria bacterium]|nr:SDR family oxidoreductase [Alphaproteobacteria bacterium]